MQSLSAVPSPSKNNSIDITATYARNTLALGALIILIPIAENKSLDYKILPQDEREKVLRNVSSGDYILLGYAIKEDGVLQMPDTSPAVEERVYNITGGHCKFDHVYIFNLNSTS